MNFADHESSRAAAIEISRGLKPRAAIAGSLRDRSPALCQLKESKGQMPESEQSIKLLEEAAE